MRGSRRGALAALPLALLALAGCQTTAAVPATASTELPATVATLDAEGIQQSHDGLTAGDGPVTVELWTDFASDACHSFEGVIGGELVKMVDEGMITLKLHPLATSADEAGWPVRAANVLVAAAYSAQEGTVPELYRTLDAHRPSPAEPTSDESLLDSASDAGVSAADISTDVHTVLYQAWVQESTHYWKDREVAPGVTAGSVPALLVDGTPYRPALDGTDLFPFQTAVSAAAVAGS